MASAGAETYPGGAGPIPPMTPPGQAQVLPNADQKVAQQGKIPIGGGGGGTGTTAPPPQTVQTGVTPPPESPNSTAPGAPAGQNTAPNLGTNSLPWLQSWQGGFEAPMSGQQNSALQGISDFTNNNFGLGNSQNYLNQLMSGQYLNPMENPGFQQIQTSADQLAQTQNARALQQLQSSAAAGGNSLSGGLMQQESDYMRNSNAALQQMMGQLEANQYSQERGYQQQAPALQNMLANTQLGGLSQEMSMGGVPQQLGSQEMQGQYSDWLRQIGALQGQYQYPDQMAMSELGHGYPASYQQQYGQSPASNVNDILQQLLGSNTSGGGGTLQSLLGLLGGDNTQQGATDSGTQYDAHFNAPSLPGTPTGSAPSSYGDTSWYQNQLSNEVARGNQPVANPYMTQYSGLNTGLGIAGILGSLLKLLVPGGGKQSAKQGGAGSPGLLNKSTGATPGSTLGAPAAGAAPTGSYAQPIGPGLQGTPGAPPDPFNDPQSAYHGDPFIDPNNFAGNYSDQTAFGTDNPNMQGPYMPTTQDQYGSNNPDMQGPYMPSDSGGGGGEDFGGGGGESFD